MTTPRHDGSEHRRGAHDPDPPGDSARNRPDGRTSHSRPQPAGQDHRLPHGFGSEFARTDAREQEPSPDTAHAPQLTDGAGQSGPPRFVPRLPPEPTRRGWNRRLLLVLVSVLVLVLAGVAAFGWWRADESKAREEVLRDLLTALQEGDADTALASLDTTGFDLTDEPLLTDEALTGNQSSFEYNPDFVHSSAGGQHHYQIGVSVNGVAKVVQWGLVELDDGWLVAGSDVFIEAALDASRPHVVNGIELPAGLEQVLLLPGSYRLASGLPLLEYPADHSVLDVFTASTASLETDMEAVPGVHDQVVAQVRAILADCAAERSAPTACGWPLVFTNGVANDGSIEWLLEPGDPAAELKLPERWQPSAGFVAPVTLTYQTIASGEGTTDDGLIGTFEGYIDSRTTSFNVDLSGEAPVVTLV